MTRLSTAFAVLSLICAGFEVFRRVTGGQAEGAFTVFLLLTLAFAFCMLAVLFQRVSRLEAALKKNSALKDH
jgi:hypothetical protein